MPGPEEGYPVGLARRLRVYYAEITVPTVELVDEDSGLLLDLDWYDQDTWTRVARVVDLASYAIACTLPGEIVDVSSNKYKPWDREPLAYSVSIRKAVVRDGDKYEYEVSVGGVGDSDSAKYWVSVSVPEDQAAGSEGIMDAALEVLARTVRGVKG